LISGLNKKPNPAKRDEVFVTPLVEESGSPQVIQSRALDKNIIPYKAKLYKVFVILGDD